MRLEEMSLGQRQDAVLQLTFAEEALGCWCAGHEAVNSDHLACKPTNVSAAGYDVVGALKMATHRVGTYPALLELLCKVLLEEETWLYGVYAASGILLPPKKEEEMELLLYEWNDGCANCARAEKLYRSAMHYIARMNT